MSVVAWDGKTLAADRAVNYSGTVMESRKSMRLEDGTILAWSGRAGSGWAMVEWFKCGADLEHYPSFQSNENDWVLLIVVRPGEKPVYYEQAPAVIPVFANYCAWGVGMDLALGAMAAGADARRAVEIACIHEASCGFGVDVYETIP